MAHTNGDKHALGKKILATIRSILQRCDEIGEKIGYPGEGGERRFRAWLGAELLSDTLKWPSKNVVIGERFDVLLVNDEVHAVATIETKTPYHQASKKERTDFEERLSGHPTLRTAYFTNGPEWERLDVVVSGAELRILDRSRLDSRTASPALAELFFAPLQYRAADDASVRQVYQVNRNNPFIAGTLSRLAYDLDEIVEEFTILFRQMFYGIREGRAGEKAKNIAEAVYTQWCGKSLRVAPHAAAQSLIQRFKEQGSNAVTIGHTLSELGLDGPNKDQVIEAIMSLASSRREDEDALIECLWPAFALFVDQLGAQTAHVVLARSLLYRVGEDEKVFPRRLSGGTLNKEFERPTSTITGRKFPATNLLEDVRTDMQTFLPAVYLRGEFDWWAVSSEKRVSLSAGERAWLRDYDVEMERLNKLMLRRLSHYQFESVDVDIWRNIYEHYLPEDERQRLGGFYTPDELVNLVLDLDEYVAQQEGLCELTYIDPACGSGAFVTAALGRLLAHLDADKPCHKELKSKGEPEWKRAEQILNFVASRVHAIDLHPFASFLTTLNVLFMVLPFYVAARKRDPDFTIELHVFSADSLERPDKKTEDQMHMFSQMNSRIQLSADNYDRYRKIMDTKFDRVFGNPPWGGVLKGPLAPVYDTAKKKHFAQMFRSAAKGKYDIYALFVERSLQLLKVGGRFALLTQDTYLDKEWAQGLRELLASKTRLDSIVDLNPFGQLFFRAMNAPCVTAAAYTSEESVSNCLCVTSHPAKAAFSELNTQQRREKVVETVRDVLRKLAHQKKVQILFASGARITQQKLRDTVDDRWDLSDGPTKKEFPEGWFAPLELFEPRQGLTPGAALDVFLMDDKKSELLNLEKELVHKAIKGIELVRWHIQWKGRMLFYPYHFKDGATGESEPAFTITLDKVTDKKLRSRLIELKIVDALDFDQFIDDRELAIIRDTGVNNESALLKHRSSLGLIRYPAAARYLVHHYSELQTRVFKKKNIRQFNRRWYEYIWPREPGLMLRHPRILSPRLVRKVRWVLDDYGYLSDDACIIVQPTDKTSRAWGDFSELMTKAVGKMLSMKQLLQYCLAFLNSQYAQERLLTGHRPTPKGSYAITEAYLKEIPIPKPYDSHTTKRIMSLVDKLEGREFSLTDKREVEVLETKLEAAMADALNAASTPKPRA